MFTVLIVEDDQALSRILSDFFTAAGYQTLSTTDGDTGYRVFLDSSPDLIILDIMLPTIDGFSLCRKMRQLSSVPIIIITGRTSLEDHLMGYDLKADDYITKPFNPEVLVAKAGVILARIQAQNALPTNKALQSISCDGIEIDQTKHTATVDGVALNLEPKQYQILWLLMKNVNVVFSREQLLNEVWGYEYYGNIRVIDTQINKLRKQLMHKANMVQTVAGTGYKFCRQP